MFLEQKSGLRRRRWEKNIPGTGRDVEGRGREKIPEGQQGLPALSSLSTFPLKYIPDWGELLKVQMGIPEKWERGGNQVEEGDVAPAP